MKDFLSYCIIGILIGITYILFDIGRCVHQNSRDIAAIYETVDNISKGGVR